MAAEAGSSGVKLVSIRENGDRQFDLIATPEGVTREIEPEVSPDGKWIVFASTRGRTDDKTSLWIARVGVEVPPERLTEGALDSHPTWTPDGAAIVFARLGDTYDLWQVTRAGVLTKLTEGEGHEVTPSIAADGAIIYAAVDKTTGASHLEERARDGTITKLTPGPDEREPAISPDGKTLAFTSRVERGGRKDGELWWMQRGSKDAQQLVDLPPTDETGPVWSRDGRFVFATSVLPGAAEQPLFASVVFVDRTEAPRRVRILRDTAGAIVRLTPSLATPALDATALRSNPEYLPELANVMAAAIARQRQQ